MKLFALALLLIPTAPTSESFDFTAVWQPHEMDQDAAPGRWSYSSMWVIDVPAPSSKPSSVDVRAFTSHIYKHIARSLSPDANRVEFSDRTFRTTITLEGVELATAEQGHADIGAELEPGEWFWGPSRGKVRERSPVAKYGVRGFPAPSGGQWRLVVYAVTYFDFESDGATMFGQSLRQRVKGRITYNL